MPEATTPKTEYFPEFRIYKPSPAKNGAASKLQIKVKQEKYREVFLFWEAAQQTGLDDKGNASFGWNEPAKKITFKMEAIDIGEVLAVLNGTKEFAGAPGKDGKGGSVFHKSSVGNTVFKFTKLINQTTKLPSYYMALSSKKNTGELIEVKHSISASEGEILRVILADAISLIYNWK